MQLLPEADPMTHDACPLACSDGDMLRLMSSRLEHTLDNPLCACRGGSPNWYLVAAAIAFFLLKYVFKLI